jgi:hypothetical protein
MLQLKRAGSRARTRPVAVPTALPFSLKQLGSPGLLLGLILAVLPRVASAQNTTIPRDFIYFGNQLVTYQANFTDVPPETPYYSFVNTIFATGISSGCGATTFCPDLPVTREAMALFLLKAKEGPNYVPTPCGRRPQIFDDVALDSPFCPWIQELYLRGIVSGCGPKLYCPSDPVTRDQVSVFLLRTLDPALSPPSCVFPGIFSDVPSANGFCRWVEELVRRNIATGCQGPPTPMYCPAAFVTRGQMATFLVVTFGIPLQ